jgi:CRISPR-associated endoribonuclease Cas6
MRVKISFARNRGSNNSVPLHHQKIVSTFINELMQEIPVSTEYFNFSSLKGTSKVQKGFMHFLSSKLSLVISSDNDAFVEELVKKIFEKPMVFIGKLELIPKTHQVIPAPEFKTKMKYIGISPLVLIDPDKDEMGAQVQMDPTSHEFSDFLYNTLIDRMEQRGYTEQELNDFAVFEASPDKEYVDKINQLGKKYARIYKNNSDKIMMGYLLPFTLHAHNTVHKYIWDCGLGVLSNQGYGMIDVVAEEYENPQQ